MYRLLLTAVIYSHADVGGEIITPSGCPVLHTNVLTLTSANMQFYTCYVLRNIIVNKYHRIHQGP